MYYVLHILLTSKPAKPNFNLMSMAANYPNFSRSN